MKSCLISIRNATHQRLDVTCTNMIDLQKDLVELLGALFISICKT